MPFGVRAETLLDAREADLGRWHELAVDDDGAVVVHEIPNRAAVTSEVSDAATDFLELRDGWRRRRRCLCAGLRKARQPTESERGNG